MDMNNMLQKRILLGKKDHLLDLIVVLFILGNGSINKEMDMVFKNG